ncbi:MAG: class I tRNA ligase family protein, partial [Leptospiraceae bacterium]|nr:class I tRNA ligase family protein [Leptospiraceae bacterium]
ESAESARQCAYFVLRGILGLVHPFMPAISEEIFSYLLKLDPEGSKATAAAGIGAAKAGSKTTAEKKAPKKSSRKSGNTGTKTAKKSSGSLSEARTHVVNSIDVSRAPRFLMWEPWPAPIKLSTALMKQAELLSQVQEIIGAARAIRADTGIAPDRKIRIIVSTGAKDLAALIKAKQASICRLASAESVETSSKYQAGKSDAFEAFAEGSVYVPLEGLLDIPKELGRIEKEADKLRKAAGGIEKKLSSSGFLDNAPVDVVEKEKAKLEESQEKLKLLEAAQKRLEALK